MHTRVNKIDSFTTFLFQECGKGYYAARTGPLAFNRTCMICPRGSYSDTDTAYSCIQCATGQTTAHEGSTNSSNCQGSKITNSNLFLTN